MSDAVSLGAATAPSGALVVIDPGMLHHGFWCGSRVPAGDGIDYAIEGADAEKAGRAYDRQWHPRYVFDGDADSPGHFESFVRERRLDARLVRIDRVPHRVRVDLALAQGGGAGEVMYGGLWAAVVAVPRDRPLPVIGVTMDEREFEGRWRFIDLEVDSDLEVARTETAGLVMVDYGLLMFADADALGAWRHESLDGLADFVFRGRDAALVAERFGARRLGEDEFGWRDLPVETIERHALEVQRYVEENEVGVGVDFRPHSHGHVLMERLRASSEDAATLELGGARLCGFFNGWGDGLFRVERQLAADGRLVRVRIDAGTDEHKEQLRRLMRR